jgi:hypothetical protein
VGGGESPMPGDVDLGDEETGSLEGDLDEEV